MSIKIRSLKVLEGIERDAGIKAGATNEKEDHTLLIFSCPLVWHTSAEDDLPKVETGKANGVKEWKTEKRN